MFVDDPELMVEQPTTLSSIGESMPLIKGDQAWAETWEVLVYGSPGVGKTTLFADAPGILYIEVDQNGHVVLQDHKNASDINIFHTQSWSELVGFVTKLPTSELLKTVNVIALDTLSQCQTLERLREIGGDPLTDERSGNLTRTFIQSPTSDFKLWFELLRNAIVR